MPPISALLWNRGRSSRKARQDADSWFASEDQDPKAERIQAEMPRSRREASRQRRPGIRDSCDDRAGARPDGRLASIFKVLKTADFPERPAELSTAGSSQRSSRDDFDSLYIEEGVVGLGAFSSVTHVRRVGDKGRAPLACKVLRLAPDPDDALTPELSTADQVQNEVSILRRLSHPNVSKLMDVFHEPGSCRLVMPLLSGGDLLDALRFRGSFPEEDARMIMRSLLSALKHVHSHGIAHRDVKLENMLLAEPHDLSRVVLIDFGLAQDMADNPRGSACGTPMYVAPEVVSNVDKTTGLSCYGCACDIWSAGVVMYMLLSGSPPFSSSDVVSLLREVRAARVRFHDPVWHLVSDEAKSLILALLTASPRDRITVDEALGHEWFAM